MHPDVAYLLELSHGVAPYIPDIVHFVIGTTHTSTHQPTVEVAADFQLQHWLAIKSVRDILKPQHIYCHVVSPPPSSQWWTKAKSLCTQLLPTRSLSAVFGRPIHHAQQKSDFLRLEALLQYGGVALDLDTLATNSWKADANQYQLCFQQDFIVGLTQSAKLNWADRFDTSFIGAKKDSPLLREWYSAYRMFNDRSEVVDKGGDESSGDSWAVYDDHVLSFSAALLWTLNTLRPHLITQLQPTVIGATYANEPEGIQRLYGEGEAGGAATGWTVHLWAGRAREAEGVAGKGRRGEGDACGGGQGCGGEVRCGQRAAGVCTGWEELVRTTAEDSDGEWRGWREMHVACVVGAAIVAKPHSDIAALYRYTGRCIQRGQSLLKQSIAKRHHSGCLHAQRTNVLQ